MGGSVGVRVFYVKRSVLGKRRFYRVEYKYNLFIKYSLFVY